MSLYVTTKPYLAGLDAFIDGLEASIDQVIDASCLGLQQLAYEVMDKSLSLVPRDTNALADSSFVNEPQLDEYGISVTMGYGSASSRRNPKTGKSPSVYAEEVHEDIWKPHKNGKTAKFLELPYLWIARAKMVPYLADYLGQVFSGQAPNMQMRMSMWRRRGPIGRGVDNSGRIESFMAPEQRRWRNMRSKAKKGKKKGK